MSGADRSGAATGIGAKAGRRRAGQGTLWIIVVLFASSGLLRIGDSAGRAFALAGSPAVAAAPATCEPAPDFGALLGALRNREADLATREAALESRAQTIALAQVQLDLKLAELVAAEDQLAATLAIADGAAEGDVTRLVTLYENMKPKEAAALFAEMAPEFAAGFLSRMRPDAAAQVLAGLDPKTAYAISVLIAGRNARAPVE